MSKVRVHELAKEFGLENKEALTLLQQEGVSVKTHSSSVDEDEGRAALRKHKAAPDDEKPKANKRAGMMIIKKKKKKPEEAEVAAAPAAEDDAAAPVTEEPAPAAEEVAAAAPVEAAPEVEAPSEPAPVAEEPESTPVVEAEASPAAEAQPEATAAPAEAASAEPSPEETASGNGEAAAPKDAAKPGGAKVVRMIDRDKLVERAGRRVGTDRPSRGDGQKFGRVTELRVVNDPFGRGREMINVDKNNRGKPGGKGNQRRGPGGPGGGRKGRDFGRERTMTSRLRRKNPGRKKQKVSNAPSPMKDSKKVVKMDETITLGDFAQQMGVKVNELIGKLMSMGEMMTINQPIDFDMAEMLATDYGWTVQSIAFDEEEALGVAEEPEFEDDELEERPPVVTIMGHVDHGKTSLLDAIRKTKVTAGEAGGITQHIGAYQVELKGKGKVTFIDTPGHAAFTEMRARGAKVTDIVILVVAADDGVMPQTKEAIQHAQAAEVPIIVAINKIDKPEANPDKVTQELTSFNLVPEAWGGDTLYVNTSALNGTGLEELLESILLQSEVMELKAHPTREAMGVVVEAQLDKGRGAVATILVQHGQMKRGDAIVVGEHSGKVRAMTDDEGKQLKEVGPSAAVEIIGLDGVPSAGDTFNVVDSPEKAREVAQYRAEQRAKKEAAARKKTSLDDLMSRMTGEEAVTLKVVLKADVQGSSEAVRDALAKLSTDEVKVDVIYSGVGGISESDIMLAAASDGLVLGFNVRPDSKARQIGDREGVDIRTYSIIYEMVDEVKKAMEGQLAPDTQEKVVGRADVREVFQITKVGTIAGCRVIEGKAMRSARVRVLRDNVQVYDSTVSSLKHYKDDVREVDQGQECGVGVEGFNDIKNQDQLEFYTIEEVRRTLETPAAGRRPPSSDTVEASP
ncbi:MAG: translation initiation factor IF-2 [Myxococcota bacterium]